MKKFLIIVGSIAILGIAIVVYVAVTAADQLREMANKARIKPAADKRWPKKEEPDSETETVSEVVENPAPEQSQLTVNQNGNE